MDFSHISSYLSSDSRSGWREKLLEASFRGVPFKVEEESAGSGVCRHPIACANNFRGDAEFRSGAGNNTRAEHWLAFRHASGTEQCTGGEKHG